ncbi:MAG TPA: hypothetical protein VF824_14580 [Thermoanaerobaculia bacterium]|jgi:hypothetical protein
MGRYIKKLTRVGSLGPTEERGAGLWVGYDLVGIEDDLSDRGMIRVDGWPEERIAEHGIATFRRVERGDAATYAILGIERK